MSIVAKLRAYEPVVLSQLEHPALRWAKPLVVKRRLLSFSMQSTAFGVAFGFLAGAIPGPLQVLTALLLCIIFRANIIAAVAASFWTNPLTIVPAYLLAHAIGRLVLPGDHVIPSFDGFAAMSNGGWLSDLAAWAGQLGKPLLVGLPLLAITLASFGYLAVWLLWKKSDMHD